MKKANATTGKPPKTFVLDTNVILHDYRCIYNFQENNIVIPIVVLEELDKFKKGNEQINYNAREFARILDSIAGNQVFTNGVALGENLGRLCIATGKPFTQEMMDSFDEVTPDHRILAVAYDEKKKRPSEVTVLVSKDINLRMKAKSLGIDAQDYLSGQVKDVDHIKKDAGTLEVDAAQIAALYSGSEGISVAALKLGQPLYANRIVILKSGDASALACYSKRSNRLMRVDKIRAYGIEPRNAEQTFAMHVLTNPDIQLVSLTGIAGTGKTLLALAAALAQEEKYDQILLSRPVIPLQNQDMGFLPGAINEKLMPYMLPLYDNLTVIKSKLKPTSREAVHIEELQRQNKLMITPLAYIRGRSLNNTFFIIDEAQNLTPHEVKTIVTRAGEGTKMVFTGDIQQIDSPYLDIRSNGLTHLSDRMVGEEIFAHVNLVKGERSELAELAGKKL
ncbi:MAG: PhoH family protein [Prevotellaceae bacterium]|jgi:PhoH-like ATPase|nr:PhoH family protein [Prevotellaceae bacterium]